MVQAVHYDIDPKMIREWIVITNKARLISVMLLVASLAWPKLATSGMSRDEEELTKAAAYGELEKVKAIAKRGVDVNNTRAMWYAAESNRVDILEILIQHGAKVDGSKSGEIPIFAAILRGKTTALEFLLKSGADPNTENSTDSSMISTPLIYAVYYGNFEAARMLVKYGADVNKISRNGNTALHQAIRHTNGNAAEFVKFLLANKANPEIRDKAGYTAREFAKGCRDSEVKKLFAETQPKRASSATVAVNFTTNLDRVNAVLIESLLQLQPGSLREFKEKQELWYYDGPAFRSFSDCRYTKSFTDGRDVGLTLIVALCGAGPFDEQNLSETLSMLGKLYRDMSGSSKEFRNAQERFATVSQFRTHDGKNAGYSYLLPFIGHGIVFVPTGVIHDQDSHVSLVVQMGVGDDYFESIPANEKLTAPMQRFSIQLYEAIFTHR